MSMATVYSEGPGYLIAEVSGQWEEHDAERTIKTTRDEANKRNLTRLFIDLRNLKPPRDGTTRFFTGESIANHWGQPFRTAVIWIPGYFDGFAETVAVNRAATIKVFFEKDDPKLVAEELLQTTYGKSDNILFVVDPHDDVVFSSTLLPVMERLTELAWQIPHSQRVDSLTNYQYPRAEGDDIFIEDFIADPVNYTVQSEGVRLGMARPAPQWIRRALGECSDGPAQVDGQT